MHPLEIPELLQEVAECIDQLPDLSSLSQVDRLAHAVVTPYLFRDISISFNSFNSLANAIRADPARAGCCRSFTFCRGMEMAWDAENFGPIETLLQDIVSVFDALSQCHPRRLMASSWMRLPLAHTHFTQLRILHLEICDDTDVWDGSPLQALLDTLLDLEDLSLEFQVLDSEGITLGSTHPRLRRFALHSEKLVDESDFLVRHPGIETLFLDTRQCFRREINIAESSLRTLSLDEYSLSASPTILQQPLRHLRFREVNGEPEVVFEHAIRAVSSTLRCLELDFFGGSDDPFPSYILALIENTTALDELAILARGISSRSSCTFLDNVLEAVGREASVRALHLRGSQESLPRERLDDLGPLPPQLKYIQWDLPRTSYVYVVERRRDKNVVSETIIRPTIEDLDWTEESVLRFLRVPW
ncbi:hypothetical protein R3P38DRAFT_2680871, partial [Favolaschia claudopus]